MGRPPCCDKSNVKRGLWTAEEDMKILAYVSTHGVGNWTSVPKKAGLKRCGKSCRLRWTNYLRPDLKHDSFTPEEEELIIHLHATIGSRWSIIAGQLPGRTDNDVKNFWNTKLKKKLCEMGIDPVTHKPIAQIIADYGSIGLPKLGMSKSYTSRHHQAGTTRISCLNRDLKKAFQYKSHTNPPQKNVDSITLMSNSSSQPWELLAQLQAMQLVAEASGSCYNGQDPVQPCLFTGSSSSSASSSCFGTNQQGSILQEITQVPSLQHCSQAFYPQMEASSSSSPPSSFSWSEFLSDDAFLLPIQEDVSMFLSATDSSSAITITDQSNAAGLNHAEVQQQGLMGVGHGEMSAESSSACAEASSKSFVDEILDHESEMPWDFTDILMQENQDP